MTSFHTSSYVRFWLQTDIQSLEIEVRLSPRSGHSEARAGLPLLTQPGPRVIRIIRTQKARTASSLGGKVGAPSSLRQTCLGEAVQEMVSVWLFTVWNLGLEACQGKIGIDRKNLLRMALGLFVFPQLRVARR